jgi:hypothetical protein
MPVDVTLEVTGVAEALKALAQADPELRKAVIKDMKQAGRPLEAAARALLPDRPLRNWYGWQGGYNLGKAQKGIKVAFRGGKVKGKSGDHFPLLSLRQTDAGGAIFEMAGRAGGKGRGSEGGARGAAMIRKLDTYGEASRTLWPTVERNFGDVEAALLEAIDTMSDVINREIVQRA